jgi:hypothetical protein
VRRAFARDDAFAQRANHAIIGAFGRANGDGVQMILRGERVARVGASEARADDAPGGCSAGETIVDDDSLMGAMKGAEAEMHDAGCDAREVVGRTADAGR